MTASRSDLLLPLAFEQPPTLAPISRDPSLIYAGQQHVSEWAGNELAFKHQVAELINILIKWLKEQAEYDGSTKTLLINNARIFEQNLFDDQYTGNQSGVYFEEIKFSLENIYSWLLQSNKDTKFTADFMKNLIETGFTVCGPGLNIHLLKAYQYTQEKDSIQNWLSSVRANQVVLFAERHIAKRNIYEGNAVHVHRLFENFANENGFGLPTLSVASDPYANNQHCQVDIEDLTQFVKSLQNDYTPKVILENILFNVRTAIIRLAKKNFVEPVLTSEPSHLTEIQYPYNIELIDAVNAYMDFVGLTGLQPFRLSDDYKTMTLSVDNLSYHLLLALKAKFFSETALIEMTLADNTNCVLIPASKWAYRIDEDDQVMPLSDWAARLTVEEIPKYASLLVEICFDMSSVTSLLATMSDDHKTSALTGFVNNAKHLSSLVKTPNDLSALVRLIPIDSLSRTLFLMQDFLIVFIQNSDALNVLFHSLSLECYQALSLVLKDHFTHIMRDSDDIAKVFLSLDVTVASQMFVLLKNVISQKLSTADSLMHFLSTLPDRLRAPFMAKFKSHVIKLVKTPQDYSTLINKMHISEANTLYQLVFKQLASITRSVDDFIHLKKTLSHAKFEKYYLSVKDKLFKIVTNPADFNHLWPLLSESEKPIFVNLHRQNILFSINSVAELANLLKGLPLVDQKILWAECRRNIPKFLKSPDSLIGLCNGNPDLLPMVLSFYSDQAKSPKDFNQTFVIKYAALSPHTKTSVALIEELNHSGNQYLEVISRHYQYGLGHDDTKCLFSTAYEIIMETENKLYLNTFNAANTIGKILNTYLSDLQNIKTTDVHSKNAVESKMDLTKTLLSLMKDPVTYQQAYKILVENKEQLFDKRKVSFFASKGESMVNKLEKEFIKCLPALPNEQTYGQANKR